MPTAAIHKLKNRIYKPALPQATGRAPVLFAIPSPSEDWSLPDFAKGASDIFTKKRTYPPKPASFDKEHGQASEPEWAIFWALTKLGATFVFQQSFWYGRKQIGGAVADFTVTIPVTIVIRVQGEYWHYGMGSDKIEADEIQKMRFEADGFTCIDIDETDAETNPLYYAREALLRIDHSKGARS
jgi:hypothetical protein